MISYHLGFFNGKNVFFTISISYLDQFRLLCLNPTQIIGRFYNWQSCWPISPSEAKMASGCTSEVGTSSRCVSPVSTSRPTAPFFTPVATSVYRRSPTKATSGAAKPVLSSTISTVSAKGFPRYLGCLPVERLIAAQKLPQSGIKPVSVGQLISRWVAKNSAPSRTWTIQT